MRNIRTKHTYKILNHQHPQNVKACTSEGRKPKRGKLTLNFYIMKTLIFKTIAIAIFIIALIIIFFAVANMVNLALN